MSKTILAIEDNEDTVLIEEEKKTSYGLVLKKLPRNLRYTFLSENGIKFVIIFLVLDANMEAKLLDVLKKNMDTFAWSIEYIKSISPSICMQTILMEEDYTPTIEHQRWLDLTMKEVLKKSQMASSRVYLCYFRQLLG